MFIPELQQESIKHTTPSTDKSRTFNECNRLFELDDDNEIELLLWLLQLNHCLRYHASRSSHWH